MSLCDFIWAIGHVEIHFESGWRKFSEMMCNLIKNPFGQLAPTSVHQIQQSTRLNHRNGNFWQHRMILTNCWIHWYFAPMLLKSILRYAEKGYKYSSYQFLWQSAKYEKWSVNWKQPWHFINEPLTGVQSGKNKSKIGCINIWYVIIYHTTFIKWYRIGKEV